MNNQEKSIGMFCAIGFLLVILVTQQGCEVKAKIESHPSDPPADPSLVTVGPITLTHVWHYVEDNGDEGAPSGEVQYTTSDGTIKVIKFCLPVPVFESNDVVQELRYKNRIWSTGEYDCSEFISAKK